MTKLIKKCQKWLLIRHLIGFYHTVMLFFFFTWPRSYHKPSFSIVMNGNAINAFQMYELITFLCFFCELYWQFTNHFNGSLSPRTGVGFPLPGNQCELMVEWSFEWFKRHNKKKKEFACRTRIESHQDFSTHLKTTLYLSRCLPTRKTGLYLRFLQFAAMLCYRSNRSRQDNEADLNDISLR